MAGQRGRKARRPTAVLARSARHGRGQGRAAIAIVLLVVPAGCSGRQSVLDPAAVDSEALLRLFVVMLAGAVVLWLAINGAFFFVTRLRREKMSRRVAETLIIVGGIVFPTVVLATLLGYGLSMMPDQRAAGDGLTIRVKAEQWWWRVEYWPEGAEAPVVSANEIRLPAGRRTEVVLRSESVIHSFWVPALGGKMDMFPGRETRLSLAPSKPGIYRGQCAEFCGASHALMAFDAVVMAESEFAAWLEHEAGPAQAPEGKPAERGAEIFAREGCGACHAVRGTRARGNVGPDLTHVGSRHSLAAGTLGTDAEDFARWVGAAQSIKPEVEMPSFDHLSEAELLALGSYLEGLE